MALVEVVPWSAKAFVSEEANPGPGVTGAGVVRFSSDSTCKRRLGRRYVAVTADTYAKWIRPVGRGVVNTLASSFVV